MSQSRSEQEVLQAILGVAENTSDTIKKAISTLEELLKSEYQHNQDLTKNMTVDSALLGQAVSNDVKPIAKSMTDSINTMLNQYAEKNASVMKIKQTVDLMQGTGQNNPETLKHLEHLESHLKDLGERNENTKESLPVLLQKVMIDGDASVAPKTLIDNLKSVKVALDSQIKILNEHVAELRQSKHAKTTKTNDKKHDNTSPRNR